LGPSFHRCGKPSEHQLCFALAQIVILLNRDIFAQDVKHGARRIFCKSGPFGHFAPRNEQDHRSRPQLFGTIHDFGPGTLKLNGGILFGLTRAAPRQTFRWQAEYELHF
jgi:hypothetical protein